VGKALIGQKSDYQKTKSCAKLLQPQMVCGCEDICLPVIPQLYNLAEGARRCITKEQWKEFSWHKK
jgi:hypothetical protein